MVVPEDTRTAVTSSSTVQHFSRSRKISRDDACSLAEQTKLHPRVIFHLLENNEV